MNVNFYHWLLLISMSAVQAYKEPELPPCPLNFQVLPSELPMHCQMVHNRNPRSPQFPGMPPFVVKLPPGASTVLPDKMPLPMPYQPFPPMPPPGMPPPPPAMPMPMPMPGVPPHKLPVIVMPFYSQDTVKNMPPNRRPRMPRKRHPGGFASSSSEETSDTDTDTSGSSSSSNERSRQKKHKKQGIHRRSNAKKKVSLKNQLTPVLQYVTKDGYVIFEKKITKNEAKDWLSTQNDIVKVDSPKNDANKLELVEVRINNKNGNKEEAKLKGVEDDLPPVKKQRSKKPSKPLGRRDKVKRDNSEAES